MHIKSLVFILTISGLTSMLCAQSEIGSYFLHSTGANLYLNPANPPEASFSWAAPSVFYIHASEGPGLYKLIKNNVLNLSGLEDELKESNSFLYGFQGSMGGLYMHTGPLSFHIGHNLRSFTQVDYNNLLFDLLLNGNAPYVGQTIQIGPYVNGAFYNEFYAGMAVRLQQLQLGARIKRLNGYAHAHTPKHDFTLYTHDEIYQLRFQTDYLIETNLFSDSLAFDSYWDQWKGNLTQNGGWALDFGLKADILEQFTLSASLLDMGYIKWKNGASRISTEGSYEFGGLDLADLLTDSLEIIQLDSLASIVQVDQRFESYRAGLPVQFYLGFQYYPLEQWEFNALFYNAYSTGRSHPSFTLMAKFKPSEYFHTGLAYTWNRFAHVNIGWNAEAHLKWFHAFIVMDNIIDIFRPVSGNYFTIRSGVQIDFMQ